MLYGSVFFFHDPYEENHNFWQIPFFSNEQAKENRQIEESELLRHARTFLLAHISDMLTIDEFAAACGMNPQIMMKTSKRETGDKNV